MVMLNVLPLISVINTHQMTAIMIFVLIVAILVIAFRKMDVLVSGSCHRVNRPQLEAQSMVMLKNPFMFRISEDSQSVDNYVNGIKCAITCDNSFWVVSYWGVNITEFHNSISIDWNSMRQQILDSLFLRNSSLSRSEPDLFHESNEQTIHNIKPIDYLSPEMLGTNPRIRYPLVIALIRNDDDDGSEVNPNDVVSLLTVVHFKDTRLKMNTGIISQYLKQRSGNIYNLQQIYTPEAETGASFASEDTRMCVVCQTTPISRTILPCRHACVCGTCFERIDRCPLCRSDILSFFKIHDERDSFGAESEPNMNESRVSDGWFTQFNSKLNQWFGMNS